MNFIDDIEKFFENLNNKNILFDYSLRNVSKILDKNHNLRSLPKVSPKTDAIIPIKPYIETLLPRLLFGYILFVLSVFLIFHVIQLLMKVSLRGLIYTRTR